MSFNQMRFISIFVHFDNIYIFTFTNKYTYKIDLPYQLHQ